MSVTDAINKACARVSANQAAASVSTAQIHVSNLNMYAKKLDANKNLHAKVTPADNFS